MELYNLALLSRMRAGLNRKKTVDWPTGPIVATSGKQDLAKGQLACAVAKPYEEALNNLQTTPLSVGKRELAKKFAAKASKTLFIRTGSLKIHQNSTQD